MRTRTVLIGMAVCLVAAAMSFAADNPNMGTWKLNEAKSKFPPMSPKNTMVVYEAMGDKVKVTVDGVNGEGKPTHNEWTGMFDGKDYPLVGDRNADMRSNTEASKDFASTLGLDLGLGKNLGMVGGRWQLVIVDEDAKIDANLGAANDIAHIRLAKELMGLMAPIQYDPMFTQRDSAGQFHDRLQTCQAIIDWADVDETAMNCDHDPERADEHWRRGLVLPAPRRAVQAQERAVRLARGAPHGPGITDDFWSTFVNPDPTNPKKRVMTVWGQGAINVNTANAQTLLGVTCAGAHLGDICTIRCRPACSSWGSRWRAE